MSKKTGPLSLEEQRFLVDNFDTKTDQELSDLIHRNIETIAKFRASKKRPDVISKEDVKAIQSELKGEYFWVELKQQLTTDELNIFVARWVQLAQQFGNTILPTDKMQMVDLIRHEILLHRVLVDEKETIESLKKIKKDIEYLEWLEVGHPDKDENKLLTLMRQRGDLMAIQDSKSNVIKQIQNDKNALFKQLKTTRDQRTDKLLEKQKTFFEILAAFDDMMLREKEGRRMELMRLATDKAAEDLTEYLEYADGEFDRPLLNHETVLKDEEEKKDE